MHQILDGAFAEDDDHGAAPHRPYAAGAPARGDLRSDEQRSRPWRDLMRDVLRAAVTAMAERTCDLRDHRLSPTPA